MRKIENVVKTMLEVSNIKVEISLDFWQEALCEMKNKIERNDYSEYERLEERSLYYESKYLEATKERRKYLKMARELGLID